MSWNTEIRMRKAMVRAHPIISLLFFVFLSSCAEVPFTHRKSLQLVPQNQLLSMGFQQYSQVLKESRLSQDREKVQMVQRVGQRIAAGAEKFMRESGMGQQIRDYRWEFRLIEEDEVVNAFALPGGKVAVYSGILPIARDETGLAVIMGHEVAHAIANHGNERMSQALLVNMGGVALSAALSEKPDETRSLFMTVFGVGTSVGVLLPYSRLHESEADRIGLILMAGAGYDPRQSIAFWERMNKKGGPRQPEFLSTHPAPASRIADIESHMPEAMSYYRKPVP